MNWPARILFAPLRALLYVLVPGILTGGAFLLYSETGSALLMQALQKLTQGAIHCEQIAGPLTGPLLLDGLVYEDDSVRVEVGHARLDWNLYALAFGRISISDLQATRVQLQIKDTPPNPEPHDVLTALPLALRVQQATLDAFEIEVGSTQLQLSEIRLGADWTGDRIHVETLSARYAPLGALGFKGELRMEPRQLRIVQAQLAGYGEIELAGEIGYHDHFSLDAQWKNLRWPQSGEALVNSQAGTLHAEGGWQAYRFKLDGDLDAADIGIGLSAQGRGSTAAVDVETLRARVLKGEIAAQARVVWSPQLSISAQGTAQQLDPAAHWPQWPGRIAGDFETMADWDRNGMTASFQVGLRESQLRGYPLNLQSRGRYAADVLQLTEFELRSGRSRLQLQGRATPPYRLTATLNSPDLANLWPQLKGSAAVSAALDGPAAALRVRGSAQLHQVQYGEFSAGQIMLEADLHPRNPSHFELSTANLFAGIEIPSASLQAQGTVAQHRLQFKTRTQGGDIDLDLRGALGLAPLQWRGELVRGHGEPEQLPGWELEAPAPLRIAEGASFLEPACWRSREGRACLQFQQQADDMRLAFRLEDWAFAYFKSFLPPQWTASGSASGTGLLVFGKGGLKQARADLDTTAGRLNVGKQLALSFEPSQLHIAEQDDGMQAQLHIPMEQGGIHLDATLMPAAIMAQRALKGRVQLDFSDLTPLRMLTSEIESVSGRLHGDFALSGTAGHPRSQGSLQLSGGGLRLATPGIELKDIQAQLRSNAATDLIQFSASAQSGGGELKVEGQTDPLAQARTLSLTITGHQFQAVNMPQARVWISPDLQFKLNRERADLTGEVKVPRADILPRSFGQGVSPSHDQIILGPDGDAPEAGLLKIYSNVRISLGESVRFEGFGLKARLQGAINVSDEPGRPTQARGEIRLVEGHYRAYGQDLTIETGRLLFNGGSITDPAVELRAVRNPTEEVSVGIYARGTLAAPQFTLYSTPDMPQDQQLSWLVLGRGLEASSTQGERSAVSDAALSLGVSGGSYLTQKLGAGLRLDEISIGARPGQTADQAQFTIGKYLSPKLFISYGIGVFQPGQSFRLLYDIGKHFKLSTESGTESGGDLIYTIEK